MDIEDQAGLAAVKVGDLVQGGSGTVVNKIGGVTLNQGVRMGPEWFG